MAEGHRQATELVTTAERRASQQTEQILRNAQRRLEILVGAEREVFERLARAFDTLRAAPGSDSTLGPQWSLPSGTHDAELVEAE